MYVPLEHKADKFFYPLWAALYYYKIHPFRDPFKRVPFLCLGLAQYDCSNNTHTHTSTHIAQNSTTCHKSKVIREAIVMENL